MVIAEQSQTSESDAFPGYPGAETNATAQPESDAVWELCKELASDPALLDKFAADIEACGLSGETRNARFSTLPSPVDGCRVLSPL